MNSYQILSQVNVKLKIHVLNNNYRYALSKEKVKKYSNLVIKLKEEDMDYKLKLFISYLIDSSKIYQDSAFMFNFKIKCMIKYNFIKRKVIYFKETGDYFHNGKFYKKDEI